MNRFRSFFIACLLTLRTFSLFAQDSLNISRIGNWDYLGSAENIAVYGSYAYVAANDDGLRILNMQYPDHPVEVGSIPIIATPIGNWQGIKDVAVWQGYLLLAANHSGLRVFSLADPAHPQEIGACDTIREVHNVDVGGGYIFALTWDAAIIFTINENGQLVWRGRIEQQSLQPFAVEIYGSYACVGTYYGVGLYNIADPAHPRIAGIWSASNFIYGITTAGHYLYAAVRNLGLFTVDLADPFQLQTVHQSEPFNASAINFNGHYIVVGRYDQGIAVYSLSNPRQPFRIAVCDLVGVVYDIQFSERYALTANGHCGMRVVDVSGMSLFSEIGWFATPYYPCSEICESGNRVYIPDGEYGLWTVNVDDPAHPVPMPFDTTRKNIRDMIIEPPYAWAVTPSGLDILYVGIPNQITTINSVPLNNARALTILGDYCYVACDCVGVFTIDIRNPRQPSIIRYCPVPDPIQSLKGQGNTLCLIANYTLILIDVSNPAFPILAGRFDDLGYITCLYMLNQHVCVADVFYNGMMGGQNSTVIRLVNIANPHQPYVTDSLLFWTEVTSLTGQGESVYYMRDGVGLYTLDISNPEHIRETGYYRSGRYQYTLAASGPYIYANGYHGFHVYDCSAALPVNSSAEKMPTRIELHSCYPNPFNATTTISFDVPRMEQVTLNVYNIAGQLVRTLVNERLMPGEHSIRFDGSNLASGTYVYKLDAADFSAAQKMVLLK